MTQNTMFRVQLVFKGTIIDGTTFRADDIRKMANIMAEVPTPLNPSDLYKLAADVLRNESPRFTHALLYAAHVMHEEMARREIAE